VVFRYSRAMSERDEGTRRPITTGEFRATPDLSANTGQFRAFASGQPDESPWDMKAPGRNIARLTGVIVLIAVVLAIIAIIVINL
jgi:hypothetical protein